MTRKGRKCTGLSIYEAYDWVYQDIYLTSAGPDARAYYRSGGTAPNRYFVVEWNNVKGGDPSDIIGGDDTFRFEVVLYENGDFDFKYQAMTYSGGNWYCGTGAGIEDSRGLDGLMYLDSCTQAPSNKAVHFTRPAPTARVGVTPLYYSQFTHADQTVAFQVPIRNTGELGTDTYDLLTSSTWLVSFYAADGTTPLTDTDGDSIIDTGPVVQGGNTVISVKVQTPSVASGGDTNMVYLTVRSSLNTSKSKTPILQSAVPTTFAQVFRDNANGAMSLYLAQPAGQLLKKATEDNHWGYNMAVAEMPSGNFIYTWSAYRWLGNVGGEEIECAAVQ